MAVIKDHHRHKFARSSALKRPRQIPIPTPTDAELAALSERAIYHGSVEHKERKSWLGLPQPRRGRKGRSDPRDHRQNATICPLIADDDRDMATRWVRVAIIGRQFDQNVRKGDFPKHLWYRDEWGHYWQGCFLDLIPSNPPVARYKGWPITKEERDENFG